MCWYSGSESWPQFSALPGWLVALLGLCFAGGVAYWRVSPSLARGWLGWLPFAAAMSAALAYQPLAAINPSVRACLSTVRSDLVLSLVVGSLLGLVGATLTGAVLASPARWTSRSKQPFLMQAAAGGLLLTLIAAVMLM